VASLTSFLIGVDKGLDLQNLYGFHFHFLYYFRQGENTKIKQNNFSCVGSVVFGKRKGKAKMRQNNKFEK
jgi:hypothetical protein